ncbi:hypothetical protein SUGI_0000030 [Cryptomeria japonica]|uniref:uncharacterized protein LOC131036637 n=1 Tax=Cryptomeria japonica TaxID=3369 RepID=UPI002408D0B6|nr:uncharacterized protein LOC131036637 [Cryptomeria japonica]GLJ04628.1 hypothetical protein SUGI_0000030 [Cryptomeria japonica]
MEERFARALESSPEEFLALVEKHQSRVDKSALKNVMRGWCVEATAASKAKLCDALLLSTSQAVVDFENEKSSDGRDNLTRSSPEKKRRRRSARNQRLLSEEAEAQGSGRSTGSLNALRSYAHLAQLCMTTQRENGFSPADLFPTLEKLHGNLVLFDQDSALQECVAGMCEQWWRESWPRKEALLAQALPCLLAKSLSAARRIDVHRVYSMREGLASLDFTHESSGDLKQLLRRCVVAPLYVRAEEGRRFVAFLLVLNAQLAEELLPIIRAQIPFGRRSILEAYGEILLRAWRLSSSSSSSHSLHHFMQSLLEGAVYASSKNLASSIRKLFQAFITHRTQEGVEAFLFHLQEPILFRALQVANSNVRRNALLLLVDMFPLEDPNASKEEKEALLEKQFVLLEKLLLDDCPDVRSTAVEGAYRILRLFWEVVPSTITAKLLTKVVDEMAHDLSSSTVRRAVVDGMIYLLDNPQSHELLKVLLPRLSPMLDDPALAVRTAAADLLLTLKDIRALQFHKVVNLDSILESLATDHCSVAQRLTRLLLPSYFPLKVSVPEACSRFIVLVKRSPSAAARFCEYAPSVGVTVKSQIELVKALISLFMTPADMDAQVRQGILVAVMKLASNLANNQSCKIALCELFSAQNFKHMLSSACSPSELAAILHIASITPPKDISEFIKHCDQLLMDFDAILQDESKQEEVRAAHKLILAWGGFDDLVEALIKFLQNALCIFGSGNATRGINRSKQDKQKKSKRTRKVSMKLSVMKGKGLSEKPGNGSITIAVAAAWHVENLLAEEGTRKALLASPKLGDLASGLKILVQMFVQEQSNSSACMVMPPIQAYISLATHMALWQKSVKDGQSSSSGKDKDSGISADSSSGQNGLDDTLQELLSWVEQLFIELDSYGSYKDSTSTVQGKRKCVKVQHHKSSKTESLAEISNTKDAGATGKTDISEGSMINLVARVSATILKSIVDSSYLSLVVQVSVQARCLSFASAFFEYMKLQIEEQSGGQKCMGNDWKYILVCVKSSATYAAKMLYLWLKNSNDLASEASHLANSLFDLITLSESVIGSKFAGSILAVLKPWMPDLLIAVSAANALYNDVNLESERSKQGFDELVEEGKQLCCAWTVTLANLGLCPANVINSQECHQSEADATGGTSNEDEEARTKDKLNCVALDFMKTVIDLLQKGDVRVLRAIMKIFLSQAAFALKSKVYSRVLSLLHFSCGKLLGFQMAQECDLDIVLNESSLYTLKEINIHIEEAQVSLQGDQDAGQTLKVAKELVENIISRYRA